MMGMIVLATIDIPSAGRAWESSVAVHTNGWVEVCTSGHASHLPSYGVVERSADVTHHMDSRALGGPN